MQAELNTTVSEVFLGRGRPDHPTAGTPPARSNAGALMRPALEVSSIRRIAVAGLAAALLALSALPALAGDVTPPTPIVLTPTPVAIDAGASNQTEPRVSGTLVSYTDNSSSSIAYYDFVNAGRGGTIAHPDGGYDSISDVSGNLISFTRVSSGSPGSIYVFDVNNPGAEAHEVAPLPNSLRRRPSIGNGTIAWEDKSYETSSSALPDIVVYDVESANAIKLTNDNLADQWPAVSEDGTAVAWVKCSSATACDVWAATRNSAGTWSPVQLTGAAGQESLPDTNGQIAVYGSNASGEWDIYWQPVGGGTESRLVLPGVQRNPNVSGSLISFESSAASTAPFDIYVYDLSTGILYQLTQTTLSESLSDISLGADGIARVVWTQPKQVSPYDYDVYGLSFTPQPAASRTVEALFDQIRSHKLGSVVPIRLQVLDGQGNNISSPSLVLTATGVVQKDSTADPLVAEDAGNANPDSAFRYDDALKGYAYNLSSKGLSVGSWELQFTMSGDSATYRIGFDLK
jgi:hypothetical protein